jgi:hypothetical protein
MFIFGGAQTTPGGLDSGRDARVRLGDYSSNHQRPLRSVSLYNPCPVFRALPHMSVQGALRGKITNSLNYGQTG